VKPPDDDELLSLEALEGRLRRDLAGIERDLDSIVGAAGEHPGDEVDTSFDGNVLRLENTIGDLRRAIDRLSKVAPVDLTRVAARALNELLLAIEKPLVLHVSWDDTLPHPAMPAEALSSVVTRMMTLVIRYLAPGDELALRTLRDGDEAVLSLRVAPAGPWGRPDWVDEFVLRCRSLGDFVEELGGRFVLDPGDEVQVELRLKLGVGVH
jgi:hypothetical protein